MDPIQIYKLIGQEAENYFTIDTRSVLFVYEDDDPDN